MLARCSFSFGARGPHCRAAVTQSPPTHLRSTVLRRCGGVPHWRAGGHTACRFHSSTTATAAAAASSSPTTATDSTNVTSVSRLSVGRSMTATSRWETVPNWCELCAEPVNLWDTHIGKREHIAMETALMAAAAHPRRWRAGEVWEAVELFNTHYARRPRGQPRPPSAKLSRLLKAGLHVPAVDSPLNFFYDAFDKDEPAARRAELLASLLYLQERGLLPITSTNINIAALEGNSVVHKEAMPLLLRIYPRREVRSYSALHAMVLSTYGAEAVYDTCGLSALLTPDLIRAFAGKGGLTPSSAAISGHEMSDEISDASGESRTDDDGDAAGDAEDGVSATVRLRTLFPRAILGMLRWSLEPESMQMPPALFTKERRYDHYATVAAYACRLLLSEMVFLRVCEYGNRVEYPLRVAQQEEAERQQQRSSGGARRRGTLSSQMRTVPSLPNDGSVELIGGSILAAAGLLGAPMSRSAIQSMESRRLQQIRRRDWTRPTGVVGMPLSRAVTSI